jgi:hypothetical protein
MACLTDGPPRTIPCTTNFPINIDYSVIQFKIESEHGEGCKIGITNPEGLSWELDVEN